LCCLPPREEREPPFLIQHPFEEKEQGKINVRKRLSWTFYCRRYLLSIRGIAMYKASPDFNDPTDKNEKIWRYMDIPKYLSLLERRALYFARANCLGDSFEGSVPSSKGQVNLTEFARQTAKEQGLPLEKVIPVHGSIRNCVYVCSFHLSNYESAALWSIYTRAMQGIAIQSTFNNLCGCFNGYPENPINIGMVNYIDYTVATIPVERNAALPFLHKRVSFEHEKELRAVISFPKEFFPRQEITEEQIKAAPSGIYIPVDLNTFIERIFVAPMTEPWIKGLLELVTKRYGLDKPIIQSSLDASPIL
jgi:hypothetical protein